MPKQKVWVTLEQEQLAEVDDLIAAGVFSSRSHAMEVALIRASGRRARSRLARECARLDSTEERALAEWGLWNVDASWPVY